MMRSTPPTVATVFGPRMVCLLIVALITLGAVAFGHAQTFGKWVAVTKGSNYFYAASINESGHAFGQYCYLGETKCLWLIGMKTACEQDSEYPVLANSDAGSVHLKVYCAGRLDDGRYRAFTDFDQVDNLCPTSQHHRFCHPAGEE